jgi:hypothetical protein
METVYVACHDHIVASKPLVLALGGMVIKAHTIPQENAYIQLISKTDRIFSNFTAPNNVKKRRALSVALDAFLTDVDAFLTDADA